MNPLRPTNGTSDGDPVDGFRRASLLKFFYVGIGVKRWLLIGALGIGVCAFGLAFLLRKLFALTFPDFLPSHFEGALLLAVGLTAIAVSLYGLARSVGPHLLGAGRLDSLAESIYVRRSRGTWSQDRGHRRRYGVGGPPSRAKGVLGPYLRDSHGGR